MRKIFLLIVAIAAGLMAFLFVQFGKEGQKVGVPTAFAKCTEAAPQCLPPLTLQDLEGKSYHLPELTGKVVVVNFWATWCGPCQAEAPALTKIREKYGNDMILLGVLADPAPEAEVQQFVQTHNAHYPIVLGNRDILTAFGYPEGLPTTLVYGKTGHLEFRGMGELSEDELAQWVEKLR